MAVRQESGTVPRLVLLWLALPPLLTFALSAVVPLYVDRFLIIVLPAYLVCVAVGVAAVPSPAGRLIWGGLIVALSLGSVVEVQTSQLFAKGDWRGLARYLQVAAQPLDVIALRAFQDTWPFRYYYGGPAQQAVLTTNRDSHPLSEIAAGHRRLWLVFRRPVESIHALALTRPFLLESDENDPGVLAWIQNHQDSLVENTDRFPGIHLFAFQPEGPR